MKTRTLVAAIIALASVSAFAQSTPRVDQRQDNQERRIDQGVASGELTPREAARLERGQQRVDNMEANAKADGVVTRRERAKLQHAQNVESRRIHRQKHDAQHQ